MSCELPHPPLPYTPPPPSAASLIVSKGAALTADTQGLDKYRVGAYTCYVLEGFVTARCMAYGRQALGSPRVTLVFPYL